MRTISGQPQVMWDSGGFGGFEPAFPFSVTNDGYLHHFDTASHSGHETRVHSSALASPNNAPTSSRVGFFQHYSATSTPNLFAGSVPGGVNVGTQLGDDGATRQTPDGRHFAWNGGAPAAFYEVQFQNSAGAYSATANTAALVGTWTGASDGRHKKDLELYGPGTSADTWRLLGGVYASGASSGSMSQIRKIELGALTGMDSDTAGTRATTLGGYVVDGSGSNTQIISDLVPLLPDIVHGFAMNPVNDRLYFISQDATTNSSDPRVYLSALDLADWGMTGDNIVGTVVDLDPNSIATYLDLTYDSGDAAPDLTTVRDLAFSPDGTELYISNGITGANGRFFIFDILDITPTTPAVVPEPASLLLLAVGLVGVALMRRRRMA